MSLGNGVIDYNKPHKEKSVTQVEKWTMKISCTKETAWE